MPDHLRCAIIDDEPLALDLLVSYVQRTPSLELCGRYSSAVEALGNLMNNPVDLLFLDIQMPELNGLDFSKMLDVGRMRIVFTTAFSQYAIEGYKVNALDYLLKPISYTDFMGAVSRAQKWFGGTYMHKKETIPHNTVEPTDDEQTEYAPLITDYFFVKSDYKIIRVNFADILYIEGLKDYVKIHLQPEGTRPLLSLTSMKVIEQSLPPNRFFRVHRSFIVNMEKVHILERGQIVFGDRIIPVSDSYRDRVQDYINAHLLQGRL